MLPQNAPGLYSPGHAPVIEGHMTRRHVAWAAGGLIVIAAILVVRNQLKVHRSRLARAEAMQRRHPPVPQPPDVTAYRKALFEMLRPVALENCRLERFGESHDGGYLMCADLLDAVQSGYSYGINGYDKWGCDISRRADVRIHQYDCFNTDRPWCPLGDTVFHEECVGGRTEVIDGRPFDTVQNQFLRNGDAGKRIVMKIDVEGAEWESVLAMPDETLAQIDQMAVEFHWEEDPRGGWVTDKRYPQTITRLKQFFEVAHIHFNNASCIGDLAPFPSWAYEVLFVSKRLAVVDPSRKAIGLHPEDSPNNRSLPDCQPGS